MARSNKKLNSNKLTLEEMEFIKLEVNLLEQRIIHLENLQYRLRQFSIALWLAALGVGLGIGSNSGINILIIGISGVIPIVFICFDTWYASNAQSFRSRRNEITYFLNTEKYIKPGKREKLSKENIDSHNKPSDGMFLLDLIGDLTFRNSKKIKYKKSFIVKLTRRVRLFFYGFQMIGSSIIISNHLASTKGHAVYYTFLLIFPVCFGILYFFRYLKKQKFLKELPSECEIEFMETADKDDYRFLFK